MRGRYWCWRRWRRHFPRFFHARLYPAGYYGAGLLTSSPSPSPCRLHCQLCGEVGCELLLLLVFLIVWSDDRDVQIGGAKHLLPVIILNRKKKGNQNNSRTCKLTAFHIISFSFSPPSSLALFLAHALSQSLSLSLSWSRFCFFFTFSYLSPFPLSLFPPPSPPIHLPLLLLGIRLLLVSSLQLVS